MNSPVDNESSIYVPWVSYFFVACKYRVFLKKQILDTSVWVRLVQTWTDFVKTSDKYCGETGTYPESPEKWVERKSNRALVAVHFWKIIKYGKHFYKKWRKALFDLPSTHFSMALRVGYPKHGFRVAVLQLVQTDLTIGGNSCLMTWFMKPLFSNQLTQILVICIIFLKISPKSCTISGFK